MNGYLIYRWPSKKGTTNSRIFRKTICLLGTFVVLNSAATPVVYAEDPCSVADVSSTTSEGGLSPCQKQIYQSGINSFDISSSSSGNCIVDTALDLSGSDYVEMAFNALNGLKAKNETISAVGAAAIVGNLMWESGGKSGRI